MNIHVLDELVQVDADLADLKGELARAAVVISAMVWTRAQIRTFGEQPVAREIGEGQARSPWRRV